MMLSSRAFCVLAVIFISGCFGTHSSTWENDLRRFQEEQHPVAGKAHNNVKQREATEYVTKEEFDQAMDAMEEEFATAMDAMKREFATAMNAVEKNCNASTAAMVTMISKLEESQKKTHSDVEELQGDIQPVLASFDEDNCDDWPCGNGGTCTDVMGGYYCTCMPGYEGKNCYRNAGRVVSNIMSVDNGNTEGEWAPWEMCKLGSFVAGYVVKLEGSSSDESGVNLVKLKCCDMTTGGHTGWLYSGEGPFGTWREGQLCEWGKFGQSFQLKVEKMQDNGDDSAVNGFSMICNDGKQLWGSNGPYGKWGNIVSCPVGHLICGIQNRVEPDQGSRDDSGLNDVRLKCCAWW